MRKILSSIIGLVMCMNIFCFTTYAEERDVFSYTPIQTDKTEPYFVDAFGNVLDEAPTSGDYIEVLYDSAWDNPSKNAKATVYQYINAHFTLAGSPSGYYASSFYNCSIGVGLYVYYDSNTLNVTSVGSPTVISFYCPCYETGRSAPWSTATASGGYAYIYGYVTYYYHTTETLSGSTVYHP